MPITINSQNTHLFDAAYYLAQNPDVAAAGVDALEHFLEFGATEGRVFSPLFNQTFYERENPDVVAAGVNSIEHYFEHGVLENRAPSTFFDPEFYLEQNPDVVAAGMNPLEHFQNFGALEGRNPSGFFDAAHYLEQNPDVAAAGLSPLEHFINHGISELRDPNASFDMSGLSEANSNFSEAITSGNQAVFQQIIQDAAEIVKDGGTIAQALTVAQSSEGDPSVVPVVPESTTEEDTISGGEDTTSGGSSGGSGGGGGSASPVSPLSLSESAGVLSVSGTSSTSSGVAMNVVSQSVIDDGISVPLGSGDYTNVTAVDASGLANSGLNLTAVRVGVATTVTGSAFADTLTGGSADDAISGGNSGDSIVGGAGADTINGQLGADTLTGEAGADEFSNDSSTDGLDIITDFAGATDVLSSDLLASAFTYFPATFQLVSNADNTQGFQFTNAAGTDNSTGMHQQDFDVTNAGAGGGKFMSETDNSAGITGSAAGDLIIVGGTTSGKTMAAGAGNDRLTDTTTNANVLQGEGGDDTMSGSDGADTFTGGADSDTFVSTFGSGADDGLDAVTDFTGADDTLDITLSAGSMTYLIATNALVSVADNTQGFRFVAADGSTDNSTGLDHVNFDETNAGAGGGKIMSMVDNSAGLTGSANADFLYFAGTTSGKTLNAAGGADNILDDSGNGNTINGDGGADTIDAGAGADDVTGGNGADVITLGADADSYIRAVSAELDIVTDFTGADDTLNIAEAAGLYTYLSATNALVLASNNTQGVRFTSTAGADNTTGLDDVEFDETNAGAGGGKFMSEIDNSAGVTGSAASDFIYLAGTTSGKTVDAGADADRIVDDSGNGNTLNGEGGADTIEGGAGDDVIAGGAGADSLTGGEGQDSFTVNDDADTIVLTETTKVLDTILVTAATGIGSTVTGFDVSNAGTDDKFTFTETAFINGNNGTKADVGVGASAAAYDVDTVNFMGVVTVTDNASADFSDAHTVIAAALANEAASDAFILLIDNGTDTRVIGWDDQAGSGGNNDGIVDSAELSVIATLTGVADVSAMTTDNLAIA